MIQYEKKCPGYGSRMFQFEFNWYCFIWLLLMLFTGLIFVTGLLFKLETLCNRCEVHNSVQRPSANIASVNDLSNDARDETWEEKQFIFSPKNFKNAFPVVLECFYIFHASNIFDFEVVKIESDLNASYDLCS